MKSYSLKLEKKAAYGITQQFSLGKYFSMNAIGIPYQQAKYGGISTKKGQ